MSWLPSIELRGAVLALGILLCAGSALAQEAPTSDTPQKGMSGGCESFKWPLDKERAAFDDAALEKVASGAARGALNEQAFALALVPVADVAYTLSPAKKKKDAAGASFGGMLAFAPPEKAGVYQVTLSGEGWIDLVQNGAALDSADHSGAKNCPGLRKSVRFTVGAAPVALQVSGVPGDSIKVAIRPVE
jgi:hypothetical protein